jgi:hypothetical protein
MKWSDPATIARISFSNMGGNMGRIAVEPDYPMISIWRGGWVIRNGPIFGAHPAAAKAPAGPIPWSYDRLAPQSARQPA